MLSRSETDSSVDSPSGRMASCDPRLLVTLFDSVTAPHYSGVIGVAESLYHYDRRVCRTVDVGRGGLYRGCVADARINLAPTDLGPRGPLGHNPPHLSDHTPRARR